MIRAIAIALALAACRSPAKLPTCAEAGCVGPVLCSSHDGPCTCSKPGVAPIMCEAH